MATTSSYDCQSHRSTLHCASMHSKKVAEKVFSMQACNMGRSGDQ